MLLKLATKLLLLSRSVNCSSKDIFTDEALNVSAVNSCIHGPVLHAVDALR